MKLLQVRELTAEFVDKESCAVLSTWLIRSSIVQRKSADRWKPGPPLLRENGAGDEEGITLIGHDFDMREEDVAASREPVVADKGAATQ